MNPDFFMEEMYFDNLIHNLQESDDTQNDYHTLDLHKQRVNVSELHNGPSETFSPFAEHKEAMFSNDDNNEQLENEDNYKEIYSEEDLLQNDMDGPEESESSEIPSGRRIVDIYPLFEAIQRLNSHSGTNNCNFSNMPFVKEFRQGLNSIFTFTCEVCKYTGVIKSNQTSKQQLEVNYSSVLGAYAVGIGYYQCQEFFGTLDVPFMAVATYDKRQKLVQKDVKQLAEKLKNEAMAKEKQIAVEKNQVDVNGTPLIDGFADGSFPKRSYRTHYDSLSGAACIIGLNTKKVIWHGVKNKYCRICTLNKDGQPKEHICNRNYTGPSTGIESQLLLEAFQSSEKCHGVRYQKLIADGDSKTYKVIDEAKIYRNPTLKVEKIECILHLYRCAMGLLLKVKGLSSADAERLLIGIKCAVKHWIASNLGATEKIENIRKDIMNAVHHVFGDHLKCNVYFCDKEKHKEDINLIPIMKKSGMYNNIMHALARLLENARSLLHNLNTNFPEQFNSIIAKKLGGKRVNFCTGLSYEGRVGCAVISFNTGRLVSHMRKFLLNEAEINQNTIIYKIESSRLKRRDNPTKPAYLRKKKVCQQDEHYGTYTSQRLDMSTEVFEIYKNLHLDALVDQQKDRTKIERQTKSEADSNFREQIQEDVLTAEKFGKLCRAATDDDFPNLVESIRYTSESSGNTKEIKRGRIFENTAIELLSDMLKVKIESCGIFIDKDHAFLGAHPTGIIDENAIVLIKCPHLAFKMDINEAIDKRKITFWLLSRKRKNSDKDEARQVVAVNKKHDWYFEIQGLLHITRSQSQYCIFAVWSGHDETSKCIKYEYIYSDEALWKSEMESKIVRFYFNHLLPEVIDPRRGRGMSIRGVKEKSVKKAGNSGRQVCSSDSEYQQDAIDSGEVEDNFVDVENKDDINDGRLQASTSDNRRMVALTGNKNKTIRPTRDNKVIDPRRGRGMPIQVVKEKSVKKASNSGRQVCSSDSEYQQVAIDSGGVEDNFVDVEDKDDINDGRFQASTSDNRRMVPLTGNKNNTIRPTRDNKVIDPRRGRGTPIRGVKEKSVKKASNSGRQVGSSDSAYQQETIDSGDNRRMASLAENKNNTIRPTLGSKNASTGPMRLGNKNAYI